MADISKQRLKISQFKSDLGAEEFADGLQALPGINDAMRLAGLRDGAALARVRARTAERAELRAKALKQPAAAKAAASMKFRSQVLSNALDRERGRVTPEEAILGEVEPVSSGFRVVGKVATASGVAAPGLVVSLRGERTETEYTAKTGKDGTFDLTISIGDGKGKAAEGENLFYQVRSGDKVLAQSKESAAVVAAGKVSRLRILLPKTRERG